MAVALKKPGSFLAQNRRHVIPTSTHLSPNDEIDELSEVVEVALFGRCLLQNGAEMPCQATAVSPDICVIASAHRPAPGENVLVYFDHLGRLDGQVLRLRGGGFIMSINGTARRRDRLASRIEWVVQNHEFGREDGRRHVRLEPHNRNSRIELQDGRTYPVEIIDISLSGAAIRSDVRLAVGATVTLSGMAGEVVRQFDEGFAIQFASQVAMPGPTA